jgi:hypothetical protein
MSRRTPDSLRSRRSRASGPSPPWVTSTPLRSIDQIARCVYCVERRRARRRRRAQCLSCAASASIRADLVADITVRGHAVGADDASTWPRCIKCPPVRFYDDGVAMPNLTVRTRSTAHPGCGRVLLSTQMRRRGVPRRTPCTSVLPVVPQAVANQPAL